MAHLVLGLDLGPNSIGWALVDDDPQNKAAARLVDIGTRVFPAGVDNFDSSKEVSRNEERRVARAMRRQASRRRRRRHQLVEVLVSKGLWPGDSKEQESLLNENPYELRAKALDEKLSPHQLGRVLLHLNQRRGFLSNRKTDRGDSEVSDMLNEMTELAQDIAKSDCRTLGEYLYRKELAFSHTARVENDHLRSRHTRRKMLADEFDAIWSARAQFYPELLTAQLAYGKRGKQDYPAKPRNRSEAITADKSVLGAFGIHGLIFFQRTMYWPKSVVGLCDLESKEKRCPRAFRQVERFRILQEVNNLRYTHPESHVEEPLSAQQRKLIVSHMGTKPKITFDQIRNKLGFTEGVKFNLERGARSFLKGMSVDVLMAKAVGHGWHDLDEATKDEVIKRICTNEETDTQLADWVAVTCNFNSEQVDAALDVDLPTGYSNLSLKAIEKLLPHLEEGRLYQADSEEDALHAAGYFRRDELQRRLFDTLPDFRRLSPSDCKLGDIPNPVVKRALVELRKVVNAIIREYGVPAAIHVEMARSLKMGPESRKQYNKANRDREQARNAAAEKIRELGIKVRREGIIRHLLWVEQKHQCIYCGHPISQQQLFGGEIDIDHIFPYSRSLDDSQANKVVCHRRCNQDKGQRTPYEWLAGSNANQFEEICQRAGRLMREGGFPYHKYRRFVQKELKLDDFIARQLVDTSYIATAAVEYLKLLFKKEHAVLGLKGQLTAELRYQWGLHTILEEIKDSPAWVGNNANKLKSGEKNRADHRHHAIDALVISLTNRSRLKQLTQLVKSGGVRKHGEILDEPWGNFRASVLAAVRKINVSHRVARKVRGKLHEETLYGPTGKSGEWVSRKSVSELSPNEIEKIRDDKIRKIVENALRQAGLEYGRGKKIPPKKMKEAVAELKMPSGVPIKKVRLIKPEQTVRPLRTSAAKDQSFVKPGANHHVAIFEFEERGAIKREAIFVTRMEAAERIKQGLAVVQRRHPDRSDARFVMSLSSGELLLLQDDNGEKLLTFKTGVSTTKRLRFTEHSDARLSAARKIIEFSANKLAGRKVTVDPLGRLRWAND